MSDILTCRESVKRLLRRSGLCAGYVATLSGRIERCRTIHGMECLLSAEVELNRWAASTMPRARVCRAALALIETAPSVVRLALHQVHLGDLQPRRGQRVKTVVLRDGAKFHQLSFSSRDAETHQLRERFEADEIPKLKVDCLARLELPNE